MKVLIINTCNSCRRATITYFTEKHFTDIKIREEWMDKRRTYIIPDKVMEDLKNEGLNIDISLLFNNSELVWIDR